MRIRIIVTGGTISKHYNEVNGNLELADSHIQDMLTQARSRLDIVFDQPMLVDSLDMTEEQRQKILQLCQASPEDRIIVTHGTDTMAETAKLLSGGGATTNKVIVLTGAMVPYAFGRSDALFNLGSALAAVQLLDQGVYITMNGKIFDWDKVAKNNELGEFQTVEGPASW